MKTSEIPGLLVAIVFFQGGPLAATTFQYDAAGRLILVDGGAGNKAGFAYDASDNLVGVTNSASIAVQQPAGTTLSAGSGTVAFGTIAAGSNTSRTFTIVNIGSVVLGSLATSVTGTNAAEFVAAAPVATGISAGGSTTFTVQFAPTATGSRTAVLHVTSNDPLLPSYDINLSGSGMPPGPQPDIAIELPKGTLVASGATKNCGTLALKKKATLTFTVHNTGTADLVGTTVRVTGPNATEFKLTANVSAAIKPTKTKTFKVQFAPVSAGTKSALLTITSNDPDENPYLVNLTGTATAGRESERETAKDYAAAAGSGLPFMPRNGERSIQAPGIRPVPGTVPLLEEQAVNPDPGSAAIAADFAGTTWTLPVASRVTMEGEGEKDGQGTLRLTFDSDGSLWLVDDSGIALSGTWACDDEGGLSGQIFPQSVEDYLRVVFGTDAGLGIGADPVDLHMQVTDEPGGPVMNVTLGLTAWLTFDEPETRDVVRRKLSYHANACGPRD